MKQKIKKPCISSLANNPKNTKMQKTIMSDKFFEFSNAKIFGRLEFRCNCSVLPQKCSSPKNKMFLETQNVLKNIFEILFVKFQKILETYQNMGVQLLLVIPGGHFEFGCLYLDFIDLTYSIKGILVRI